MDEPTETSLEDNDDSAFLAHVRTAAKQWDTKGLREEVLKTLNLDLPIEEWAAELWE